MSLNNPANLALSIVAKGGYSQLATTGSWQTVDLSVYVNAGCKAVILTVRGGSASASIYFRENGSSVTPTALVPLSAGDCMQVVVGVDSNNKFQYWDTGTSGGSTIGLSGEIDVS